MEVQYLRHTANALNLVVIYDRDKIIELMVTCEEHRLTSGALVALSITEQSEDAVRSSVALANQCHSTGKRKAMAQRSRRHFYSRDSRMSYMACQWRSVLVK